ncbi:hypothetical protein CYLTODRAFT_459568 [Cylindrobasidium torrendii FP15055 ss-10]|uniref:Uncharacterized protein n=1 Tax=Cylindrobasidium torrendii FP15055 ss-10 TaxID=1314674 RepID=A0A0D7AVB5_9AGAR|nr:hypothetical protein CYLTODRAFT_459568 [Cylindrobasidium torrendii FP15055 ss-10]
MPHPPTRTTQLTRAIYLLGAQDLMADYISDEVPRWADMSSANMFGLVGARFGDVIVATPNAKVIYPPTYGSTRHLQLREDYRWGPDDYINLPQPYQSINNHIICCPAPTYIFDDTKHLFRAFQNSDWTPIPTSGIQGLGTIDRLLHRNLKTKTKETLLAWDAIVEDQSRGRLENFDSQGLNRFRLCAWALRRDLDAIGYIKTLHQVKMQYVDILRRDMELRGFVDYVRIFRHRMHNLPNKPFAVDSRRMGCFTNSFAIADRLHHCGIPVWYVYKASAPGHDPDLFERFLSPQAVQSLQNAQGIPSRIQHMSADCYTLMSLSITPNAKVLWTGSASHGDKYRVMGAVLSGRQSPFEKLLLESSGAAAHIMLPPLPAEEAESSNSGKRRANDEPSTSRQDKKRRISPSAEHGQTAGRRGSKAHTKVSKNINRSPWDNITHAPMPAAIPTWATVLDTMKNKLRATGREGYNDVAHIPHLQPEHRWPAGPDAAMFASISNATVQASAFLAYSKLRHVIRFRVDLAIDVLKAVNKIPPQSWRYILGFLVLSSDKDHTAAAQKRSLAFEELQKTMEQMGVQISLTSDILRDSPASWRSHGALDPSLSALPPPDVCREILWEMNEINFRTDLILVDRFLFNGFGGTNAPSPTERRAVVLQRFTHFGPSVTPDDSQFVDRGFASPNLQERRDALCTLVEVMSEWQDSYSSPFALVQRATGLKKLVDVSEGDVEKLEINTASHYIRAFFGVFKRPPNVPRTLQEQ